MGSARKNFNKAQASLVKASHEPNSSRESLRFFEFDRVDFRAAPLGFARLIGCHLGKRQPVKGNPLQVIVRDNNVDQAMKVLKKRLQREGIFRELKRQRYYEKLSERKAREKGEAIRRGRKLARKRAQREGLLPMPKPRVMGAGPARPPRF